MSAILKFDFQERKQLHFTEKKISKLHKNDTSCMWQLHFPWNKGKQEQAVDPLLITLPLNTRSSHSFMIVLYSIWLNKSK